MSRRNASIRQVTGIGAIALSCAATALGCGANAANTSPAAPAGPSAEEQEAKAGLVEHHRHHHYGGVTLLLAMSLDTLGVSPEQKVALEKIRNDLQARMEPARAAEQSLLAMLADAVAAGAFDAARVDAAVSQLTSASAPLHEASVDALNQLHALLTPPQRAALIDKVEAHWSVWQKANAEESEHLMYLAAELNLSPEQVEKVRANLAEGMKTVPRFEPQEVAAHIRAFGDAFRAPTFDAKTLPDGGAATSHMVGWASVHLVHFIEAVTPVLTLEQRTKFSQMLREHAGHDPSGQGG